MKQATLHFHSGDYLLIELPENTVSVEPSYCHAIIWKDNTGYIETEYPLGDDSPHVIAPIGKLSEVTEEQFAGIVAKDRSGYKDYDEEGICSIYPFIGAKGSFLSKLKAEGLYTKNPHGEKPADDDYSFFTDKNLSLKEAWELAEAKSFPPDRSFLFRILNQQP